MPQLQKGFLIVVEGIDGSGKSTLVQNVSQQLANISLPVTVTKEPGGTKLGQQLRTILQTQPVPVSEKAEFLLFAADRAQHFREVIIPQLQAKKVIISDRMGDSSLVYQGFARGLDLTMLQTINTWVMDAIKPDLIIYPKLSAEKAMERLRKRNMPLTAFEQKLSFIKKLENGFETLYKEKEHVILLDGQLSPEVLTEHAVNAVLQWIKNKQLLTKPSPLHSGLDQTNHSL